jgi:HK97 family phage major capsid protein
VTATTRGAFTTASAVDVFALLNSVPSRYEDGTTWVANKQTFNTIKQMSTASNGSYFWSDFNGRHRRAAARVADRAGVGHGDHDRPAPC